VRNKANRLSGNEERLLCLPGLETEPSSPQPTEVALQAELMRVAEEQMLNCIVRVEQMVTAAHSCI
jgi:hypothetical protein